MNQTNDQNIASFIEYFDKLSVVFSSMGDFSGKMSLTKPELLAVDFLSKNFPLTMSEFAKILNLNLSTATNVIDRLVKKDLVIRIRNGGDRRVVKIQLSEEGAEVASMYHEQKKEIFGNLLNMLSSDEQQTLISLFEKIAGVVSLQNSGGKYE